MTNEPQAHRATTARGAKTRTALLAAGRKLFAERSVDAVAIDDIVNAAAVAKGSFYNHFADKEALLTAIVTHIREGIEARIAKVNETVDDAPARIVRALCVYAAIVGDDTALGRIVLHNDPRGAAHKTLNEGLRRDLSSGLHDGRLVFPSVDAGLLFVVGVAHSLLLSAVGHGPGTRIVTDAQSLSMLMLRAFGVPASEAELIAAQAADDIIRLRSFER